MGKRVVMNLEDGDIEKELKDDDYLKIISAKQMEFMNSTQALNKKEEFIKVFIKPLFLLSMSLSNAEAWFMTYLLQYLDYTTGLLLNSEKKKITANDIITSSGSKHTVVYDMLKRLTEKKIIAKITIGKQEESCYAMNPYIFMRGQRVSKTLAKAFEDTSWAKLFDN